MIPVRTTAFGLAFAAIAVSFWAPWTGAQSAPATSTAPTTPTTASPESQQPSGSLTARQPTRMAPSALGARPPSAADAASNVFTASAPAPGDGTARGVARAVREATLSSSLAARIVEMPLQEGASFQKGTLLVKFDCERQAAEARAASAAADAQAKMVETNIELDKFESIGKNDLSISRSQLEKARAEADALKAQLKDCNLYAPFAGRVVERQARSFEAVLASQPLLRVVDTSELEIELIVPSAWLQWLGEGARFQFRIDESGHTLAGAVTRLTPTVDPVSKTIKVFGRLRSGKGLSTVLPGMSGTAHFAHFASDDKLSAIAAPNGGSSAATAASAIAAAPATTTRPAAEANRSPNAAQPKRLAASGG